MNPSFRGLAAVLFAAGAASLLGCNANLKDGYVDYSLDGEDHATFGSVWKSQEQGHPWVTSVSVWQSEQDPRAIMQIDFPEQPGTYDCTKMWGAAVDVFELHSKGVDLSADWQNDGSSCTLTWSKDARGRVVGDFSAVLTAFDDATVAPVSVSGHFEVDASADSGPPSH